MASDSEQQPFLPRDEKHTSLDHPPTRKHWSSKKLVLSHLLISLFTSLLWLIAAIFVLSASGNQPAYLDSNNHRTHLSPHHNITTGATLLSCGTSITEAKSLGCKYDIFLNNWVPPPCYDEEWITEYQDDNSWAAFADEALTQRLTPAEMEGRDFYYTSLRDHINHCALMWNKQFWALYEERSALDTVIASPWHTEHCAQFLMDAREVNATQATKTYVGFAGCWIRERTVK
ncbi:hypothetical protein B0T16DRAFT_416986 [Cercophora newfieldiana]|uniref:Uncharacterized protein n=1 Tax=Cercophora newfieldiana TaxID=92897 RepID=A0AA39Y343_9PEZI|nr:hypothetical protein B0T16DRAFT_416986 [Cercophora newfieldiana]